MNIKTIAIALTVLVFGVLILVLTQKGNYVSQATEHYEKTTANSFKGTSKIVEYVGSSIDMNKMLWALSCEAIQTVKSSQDMAKLEGKYFPSTKGANSISKMTRRFEATSAYFIVSSFDKVEVDPKTQLKTLSGLKSIDVNALLGEVAMAAPVEEEDEGSEEE
ncbi:MAG: hypothetical protein MJY47_00970 [Fibrobacter sp.]|nr:hypothetical protein [Fibrobacter sp.]